jgi:hypothetical protein
MTELEHLSRQLESVRAAIAAIEEGAQEYSIESNGAGRKARKADIQTLYQRENQILARIQRTQGRSISITSSVDTLSKIVSV